MRYERCANPGELVRRVAFVLLAAPAVRAAEIPFDMHAVRANADGASSAHAADMDGDGDLDVLSSSADDDTIAWSESDGQVPPSFTTHLVTDTADGASSVFAADLDGDGDQDVLAASARDDTAAWFENADGAGGSFVRRVIAPNAAGASSIIAGDLDGDGDLDVAVASSEDATIAWFESDGDSPPQFTERIVSEAAPGARDVAAADVDGDGDLDLLSASTFGLDKIAWYENDGSSPPLFTERVISTTAFGSTSVAAADVDGDGDTDVLSSSGFDDKIAWYENDGQEPPGFTEHVISLNADFARSVTAADVDGDGDMDALSASSGDDEITWYDNDGASPPAFTERPIAAGVNGAAFVLVADVDGDGDSDVLAAAAIDDAIAWHENMAEPPVDVCPADLDDSGAVDFYDLLEMLSAFGPCSPPPLPCQWDLNGDGMVGGLDLVELIMSWGECSDGDGEVEVPPRGGRTPGGTSGRARRIRYY